MTERLYYHDPYLIEFDAKVAGLDAAADGRRAAILDRTAFYPTSGGQPFDTGTIGTARVIDVVDRGDGVILHVFDGDPPSRRVHGRIDWDRRFDHMQQHTGQHVLSAAFDRLLEARTVSFHLGATSSTIDLATDLAPDQIARAESQANRIVWEDREVRIRFASAEEASRLPLRKEPAREGPLRLIDVDGFDLSACGGTHVARTGAIGIISIASWERFKGGTRVEFLCGARALGGWRAMRDSVLDCTRLLSVQPGELAGSIERLQSEARDLRRRNRDLQVSLAASQADALDSAAVRLGALTVVVSALDGWDPAGLKTIASHLASRPGRVAILFGVPGPAAVAIARSAEVPIDSAALLKKLTVRFGGKGGGRPDLAQGGGLTGDASALVEFARRLVAAGGQPADI